jgi:hypothetical protein
LFVRNYSFPNLHPREFAVLRAVMANDGQSQQWLAEREHLGLPGDGHSALRVESRRADGPG